MRKDNIALTRHPEGEVYLDRRDLGTANEELVQTTQFASRGPYAFASKSSG